MSEHNRFGGGLGQYSYGSAYSLMCAQTLTTPGTGSDCFSVQGQNPRPYCTPLHGSLLFRLYPSRWTAMHARNTSEGPTPETGEQRATGLANEVPRPQSNITCLGHAARQYTRLTFIYICFDLIYLTL